MTKALHQIILFPPPKSEYVFQKHWESEYFFWEKTITPPPTTDKHSISSFSIIILVICISREAVRNSVLFNPYNSYSSHRV